MHQHKTVAQVMLILAIVNVVLAAPAVREIHEARNDVMIQALAEDVGTVAEKWGNSFGRMTPRLDPEDPVDEGYVTASDEPLDHSSTPTEQLQPAPPPPPPSAPSAPPLPRPATSKRPKIMTPEKIKSTVIITGAAVFTMAILGIVDIQISRESLNGTAS